MMATALFRSDTKAFKKSLSNQNAKSRRLNLRKYTMLFENCSIKATLSTLMLYYNNVIGALLSSYQDTCKLPILVLNELAQNVYASF